jgi:hypothetical protein
LQDLEAASGWSIEATSLPEWRIPPVSECRACGRRPCRAVKSRGKPAVSILLSRGGLAKR